MIYLSFRRIKVLYLRFPINILPFPFHFQRIKVLSAPTDEWGPAINLTQKNYARPDTIPLNVTPLSGCTPISSSPTLHNDSSCDPSQVRLLIENGNGVRRSTSPNGTTDYMPSSPSPLTFDDMSV